MMTIPEEDPVALPTPMSSDVDADHHNSILQQNISAMVTAFKHELSLMSPSPPPSSKVAIPISSESSSIPQKNNPEESDYSTPPKTNPQEGSDFETPKKTLPKYSYDEMEEIVMEDFRKLKRTRNAKKSERVTKFRRFDIENDDDL